MLEFFDKTIKDLENTIKANPGSYNSRKKYTLALSRSTRELYSGSNPVAWCGITVPCELLRTMGVSFSYIEIIGTMLASMGIVGDFLEESEHAGYAPDTCGFHRSAMGALLKGIVPKPDFLIATTTPCSGSLAITENFSKHFNKDLFVLQVPRHLSQQNVRFLADQIKDMVDFVSSHTGNPLSRDLLRETIEKTNRARAYMKEVFKLAQHVPSPTDGRDLKDIGYVMFLLYGADDGIEVAKSYMEEFSSRIASGSSDQVDEKIRLMWIADRPYFKHPFNKLLRDHGAVVVIDEWNDIYWDPIDPDDPYTSFAKRAIAWPYASNIEYRLNYLKKLAESYKIDGVINPCHWGCRTGTGARGIIEEGFKNIDIPVLNLEVDCVDSRNFSEGQLRTRLEAFIEMIERKPSPFCK